MLDSIKTWLLVIGGLMAALFALFKMAKSAGKEEFSHEQTKQTLKNAEQNQKFKADLDGVNIASKRKFLRDKFPRKSE